MDVAEYDGDERLAKAEAVRYLQLKHSTQQADLPWKTADLKSAVEGFAARFAAIVGTLKAFTLAETTVHLRQFFPDASAADAAEFHRRTSHNPRVQANAIAVGDTVADVLRLLGTDPKGVNETIVDQLKVALADVIDAAIPRQREQFAQLCAGLAILRPLIPIEILAAVTSHAPMGATGS